METFQIRLPAELLAGYRQLADERGRKAGQLIRQAVAIGYWELKNKNKPTKETERRK